MKELSIEEKTKRYDEAIEKARIWKDKSGMPKDKQGILDDIFPELRESEDERIKSAAIEFVIQNKSFNYYLGVSKDDVVTWINRQGKQKPAAWSEEDESLCMQIEGLLNVCRTKSLLSFDLYKKMCDLLKSLKDRVQPQSQWKPSDEQMDALLYVVRNYTPGVTERIAWESIKTLELMFKDLKKLKGEQL